MVIIPIPWFILISQVVLLKFKSISAEMTNASCFLEYNLALLSFPFR